MSKLKTEARGHRVGRNAKPLTRQGLPTRSARPDHREGADPTDATKGESCQIPTFSLPATAGLALPRLEGVPAGYSIDNEQRTAAQVALSFLNAGIVQESDAAAHASSNTLIKNAFTRMLGDSFTFAGLDLEFRVVKLEEQESYYLLVFVDGVAVVNFDGAAEVFDAVHPQLGPSILGLVYRNLELTPAFTPEVAKDMIRCHYWQGMDDDSVLLEEAEQELEHHFTGRENVYTDEDVTAYAQEHYLTSRKVDERLEPRYQENGTLNLRTCKNLCEKNGLEKALSIIDALEKLNELREALPERDRNVYDVMEGEVPFGLIVTLGGEHDLVREVYGEYEQMIWQGGMDFQPTYAVRFHPDEPGTLTTLRDALLVCRLVLEQTNSLCHTLEDIS